MKHMNQKSLSLIAAVGMGVIFGRFILRRARAYKLRGKTVLITGGSRGLGLVLAREFARAGSRLVIAARDEHALERARAELTARGADVLAIPCDVNDRVQVARLVESATKHFGRIDVLVNNAGTIQVGPMEEMDVEDYERAMATHFWGPLYSTLAVLPGMRERGEGRIANISSIGGVVSMPHLLPYCASKFALEGLSEGLRAELAKDGVTVTTVVPGLMRTGSPLNARFKGKHRSEYAWFSVMDAMPFVSMNANRAARKIVSAMRHGDRHVVLSLPAKFAALAHGLFPGLVSSFLGVVNRTLPAPGGIDHGEASGLESESPFSSSWVTALSARAALRNNQS